MTTLVTGAGGGIGAEITSQILASGERAIAQDIELSRLERFAEMGDIYLTAGDLSRSDYLADLAQLALSEDIDRVIAAHGVDGSGALDAVSDEYLSRVLTINFASVVDVLQALLPQLTKSRGTFLVIASQAGLVAEANNVAYCASKFGVVGWVRSLAPSLRSRHVQLRALCPGCTETPLLFAAQARFAKAEGVSTEDVIARRRSAIPIHRFASVGETAACAVYMSALGPTRPSLMAATGGEVLY